MKIVLYTQRVEIVKSYGERRDCADQNIPRFIEACGYLPVPVPNVGSIAKEMMVQLEPAGVILTGGNSLEKYGGDAPERDHTEKEMLDVALERGIPVYGFCRGMQMIADYYGCVLEEVPGHVAMHHRLLGDLGALVVNSFHNQGCRSVKPPLRALAWTEDGVIEAICCEERHVLGTMWHPERETEFREEDIKRVQELFGREEE